ncbi:MAG: outer membrane protein transport protein [Bdellovibrionaceae bacterium]|nr:outer membrane protein transport protein [Pseudobdellovibrionaceae bacterium]
MVSQIFVILLLCLNCFGYSYIDNRNLFPLGEKEMFMANTGVALTESSGNVFYNPAGLALTQATKLSLSSNSYFNSKTEYKSIQILDDTNFPFSTSGSQSIPSTLVSAWKGEKMAWAFSILVPHQLKIQDAALYKTANYETVQVARVQSFQILMIGGTWAGALSATTRLGGSCFYTTYQTNQQFDFSATPKDSSALKPAVINSFFNSEISGGICHVGLQHDVTELLHWGMTVKTPLLTSSKKGTSSQFIQEPTQGAFKAEGPKEITPQVEIPGELSAGIKLNVSERLKLYSDINYQLEASYNDGNQLSEKFEHAATFRYSGGVQFKISPKNDLLAGFAYNPSSLKKPESEAFENYFVGSLGVQSQTENSVLGVGVFIAQSYGEIVNSKLNTSFQETETFKSEVRTAVTGFLISSGFSF